MAKGKKTGGRNFTPGNRFGQGQPKLPEDIKEARKLNRIEFERILNQFLHMTDEELLRYMDGPDCTQIEGLIAHLIVKGKEFGDHRRLSLILDRLVGPVSQKVEVTSRPVVIEYEDKAVEMKLEAKDE